MKNITGNILRYRPMVKTFFNDLKTVNQGSVAGISSHNDLRSKLKIALCQLICDFTEAMDINLKRYEKFLHGQVSE